VHTVVSWSCKHVLPVILPQVRLTN